MGTLRLSCALVYHKLLSSARGLKMFLLPECYRGGVGKGSAKRGEARPQGRQGLNVSCLTRSQCLAVSMSRQVSGLRSLVLPSPLAPPARWARRWRCGNRRADMRHETRDLQGRHETLRRVTPRSFACPCNRDIRCNSRRDCLRYAPYGQLSFASACRSAGTWAHLRWRIGCRAFRAEPC